MGAKGAPCTLWKMLFCERGEFLQVQQEGRNLLHNLALQLGGNMSLSESASVAQCLRGRCLCALCRDIALSASTHS